MKKLHVLPILILMGCSSAELVENWKNPDIVIFDASKVLLVGMTQNENARIDFETRLKAEFDERDIESMRSIDLFDVRFTNSKRTEKELDDVERSLLDKDFDAILLTKIVGSESRQSFRKTMAGLNNYNDGFKEDYRRHQDIYYDQEYYERYTVYHAETSLYCICEGKDRSLIWRGSIDIMDPDDIEKTVEDYVKLVVVAMEEQDLIFHKNIDVEDVDI
ncbi:hypothetical protein ACEZ3G_04460 [Maribacter algicola]|uniref:Uncharacterized protein n=1 Tax=Meishania litoralis TaxID=3434685 RepID=A0ACC7LL79_9FLAO